MNQFGLYNCFSPKFDLRFWIEFFTRSARFSCSFLSVHLILCSSVDCQFYDSMCGLLFPERSALWAQERRRVSRWSHAHEEAEPHACWQDGWLHYKCHSEMQRSGTRHHHPLEGTLLTFTEIIWQNSLPYTPWTSQWFPTVTALCVCSINQFSFLADLWLYEPCIMG